MNRAELQSPELKPCRFHAMGVCRNGSQCKFSHEGSPNSVVNVANDTPPPFIVNLPPGYPVFSVDVECAATTVQHNGRAVVQVALVDEWTRPIFNVLIRQETPVLSYITPLTGITKEMVDAHGLPLADALALLRAHLPPNAILVGQNILKDVQWLQLAEGVDYHSLVDIAPLFRVWDPSRGRYAHFSQDHCAQTWLGIAPRQHHSAISDAAISMSLFNKYRSVQWDLAALRQLQDATLHAPRVPSFSALTPEVDGKSSSTSSCKCVGP